MAGVTERKALAALKNHFGHAAGFCGFDAREGLSRRGIATVTGEVQIDESFVDLQAILDEGNFQLFRVQAAAEGFQGLAGFLVGSVGGGAIAPGLR